LFYFGLLSDPYGQDNEETDSIGNNTRNVKGSMSAAPPTASAAAAARRKPFFKRVGYF
jgi:hypothetical protein